MPKKEQKSWYELPTDEVDAVVLPDGEHIVEPGTMDVDAIAGYTFTEIDGKNARVHFGPITSLLDLSFPIESDDD